MALAGCGHSGSTTRPSSSAPATSTPGRTASAPTTTTTPAKKTRPRPTARREPPFAVAERTLTFVDPSRTIALPDGRSGPRTLVTVVRYPIGGRGPFPLVIFGHGYAETPAPYSGLLEAWARAGYVVAAPVFPLENANAPGGPNESDLVNQPRDISFLITQLLAADAAGHGFLSGRIERQEVAVTGQSDGGETALAVAYDRRFLDPRINAAIILSGAEIPGIGGFVFPRGSPPLLATQGTADPINPPSFTTAFYDIAPAPKYLLWLLGASHLGPYTGQQPQQGIVERVTIAFLDHYLKGAPRGLSRMGAAGNVAGLATLDADP